MVSEEMHSIDFYSGSKKKKLKKIRYRLVAIPGMHVIMVYCRYRGSFVLQPQCVACLVAGVIS